jgi:hypothetical protein
MIYAKVTSTQSSRFNIQSNAAVILALSCLLLFLPVVRGEEPFRYPEAKHGALRHPGDRSGCRWFRVAFFALEVSLEAVGF